MDIPSGPSFHVHLARVSTVLETIARISSLVQIQQHFFTILFDKNSNALYKDTFHFWDKLYKMEDHFFVGHLYMD